MPKGIYKHKGVKGRHWKIKDTSKYTGQNGFKKGNQIGNRFQKDNDFGNQNKQFLINWVKENGVWNKGKKGLQKWTKGQREKFSKKNSGQNHWNWQNGKSFEPYSLDWTNTLKRAIRERDNYICQLCNQYGDNVHHIDCDKENCNSDNLITLCRSCHTKIHRCQI